MARLHVNRMMVALVFGCALVPGVQAQRGPQQQVWTLEGIRARWCVYFLVDSAMADRKLPGGYQAVPASDFTALVPAVAREVRDQPQYARWVPAQFCTIHFDAARVDDRGAGDPARSMEESQLLGAWLIAAQAQGREATGAPADPATPQYYAAELRATNWRLQRSGELFLVRSQNAEGGMGYAPEDSSEQVYEVKMGKTVITWMGHLAGDSASSAPSLAERWLMRSSRNAAMIADLTIAADSTQAVAGTLRIAGNDDLAKSLRSSPVRMVGPMTWGGGARLVFNR